jgi:thymidylate synthase ThyX
VLLTVNARELYHLVRLREDAHAQWDIRELSARMSKYARAVMPLTMLLLSGKDSYPALYQQVYGRPPKVLPPKE